MGRRGPRPKPTNLKIIEGTYRKDRAPENEARPQDPAAPPSWLRKDQLAVWSEVVPHLERVGLATTADQVVLGRYVDMLTAWVTLAKDIRGLTKSSRYHYTEAGTHRVHPAFAEFRTLGAELLKLEREFGMTPSARTGIEAAPTESEVDEWAKRARRSR